MTSIPRYGRLFAHHACSLDEEREHHIRSLTQLLEDAYKRGEGVEANRWRVLRDEAIRARSPEAVARMERERGLA